jgi:hypothetical protein
MISNCGVLLACMHADLVVSLSQVHLGEDDAPLQPLSKVHYVGEWIGVFGGHKVQPPIIAIQPPAAVQLHLHMERR